MVERFYLRPKWIAGHILLVAVVVSFVSLGLWQLRRMEEIQDRNRDIAARSSEAPRPVGELVGAEVAFDAASVQSLRYRAATATGRYDVDDEVLVRNRSLDGVPGYHVLTPLVLDDGTILIVQRGFISFNTTDLAAEQRAAKPPEGTVTVRGLLFPTQEREGIGPRDPAEGRLTEVARVDLERLQAQIDGDLVPVYLQLQDQTPAQVGSLPSVLDPPDQSDGPHLSYAFQWFAFTAIALVGYPILLVRTAQKGMRSTSPVPSGSEGPPPSDPGTAGLRDA